MLNLYHLSPLPHEYRASPHIDNVPHKFQLTHKFHMLNFHNTHHSFKNHVTHTWRSIIYICTYVSTYKHTQAITTHPKVTKQLNHTLSCPTPCSGGRASLRQDSLAQTSPPPPRRGLETRNRNHYGVSLRRDPSRLGEWFARAK